MTAKALGIQLDFRRLIKYYGDDLVRAYYYTAIVENPREEYAAVKPLVDWLCYNDYSVITKQAKVFTDGNTGVVKIKGNMDCELTVDALELAYAGGMTDAVFFTGDGDFRALLLALQRRGVRNTVVSTIQTQPPMVADELRRVADKFVDLTERAEDWKFNGENPKRKPTKYG